MEKIYFDDTKQEKREVKPANFSALKAIIDQMDVYTELEEKENGAIVRVFDDRGTSMFLAKAVTDHDWLRRTSFKQDRKGTATIYYFKF